MDYVRGLIALILVTVSYFAVSQVQAGIIGKEQDTWQITVSKPDFQACYGAVQTYYNNLYSSSEYTDHEFYNWAKVDVNRPRFPRHS